MTRFSKTAPAVLAFFGIFCAHSEAGWARGRSSTGVLEAGVVSDGNAEEDRGLLQNGSHMGVETEVPYGYGSKVLVDGPGYANAEVLTPQDAPVPIPRVSGTKTALLGLTILGGLLLFNAFMKRAPQHPKFSRVAQTFDDLASEWSRRVTVKGEALSLYTMVLTLGMVLAASGIADMIRSRSRRRAARSGRPSLPSIKGLEFVVLSAIGILLALGGYEFAEVLSMVIPALVAGGWLTVHSLWQRSKFKREQQYQGVTLPSVRK